MDLKGLYPAILNSIRECKTQPDGKVKNKSKIRNSVKENQQTKHDELIAALE